MAGIVFLAIAQLWNLVFPINKNLWSSSFVMNTVGWSLLLMALFHYIIDVKGYVQWSFVFRVIGMNSILIYMSPRFIHWSFTNKAIFEWLADLGTVLYKPVILASTLVLLKAAFLWVLYRKKIFLKI